MDADGAPLDAGDFDEWVAAITDGLRTGAPVEVACDGCTGCCAASQFVLVEADDHDARAHIPATLLAPAPGRPGDHVLGYDGAGRCPLLGSDGCTIHEHRPRACRVYDCRLFAATGVELVGRALAPIADRVRRWEFTHADADAAARHARLRSAARAATASDPSAPAAARALSALRTLVDGTPEP